jgi:hypothetical protein
VPEILEDLLETPAFKACIDRTMEQHKIRRLPNFDGLLPGLSFNPGHFLDKRMTRNKFGTSIDRQLPEPIDGLWICRVIGQDDELVRIGQGVAGANRLFQHIALIKGDDHDGNRPSRRVRAPNSRLP